MKHMRKLYYGDNLEVLRLHIPDESVDLIYLDPPFNSKQRYNIIFKDESGMKVDSQIQAFDDSWHWDETAENTYHELQAQGGDVAIFLEAMLKIMGRNQMTAYLVMMAIRLQELHRVLKQDGSIYLHCDSTSSHSLKLLMDAVFGGRNFQNDISWRRTNSHNDAKRYGRVHDTIFFYTKSSQFTWNKQYTPYTQEYIDEFFIYDDNDGRGRYWKQNLGAPNRGVTGKPWRGYTPHKGRAWAVPRAYAKRIGLELPKDQFEALDRLAELGFITFTGKFPKYKEYMDLLPGVPVQDMWEQNVKSVGGFGAGEKERTGYPTQKPVALLERIVASSSNPGDVVLDPFCGCGTTIAAAEFLERKWIGIDITHLAVAVQKERLLTYHGLKEGKDYEVIGEPVDFKSAEQLSRDDPYQFQWWAVGKLGATPFKPESKNKRRGKKGADGGVDGTKRFRIGDKYHDVVIQIKGGNNVNSGEIDKLVGVVSKKKASIGVFVCNGKITEPMKNVARDAGRFEGVAKIQIIHTRNLVKGASIKFPKHAIV